MWSDWDWAPIWRGNPASANLLASHRADPAQCAKPPPPPPIITTIFPTASETSAPYRYPEAPAKWVGRHRTADATATPCYGYSAPTLPAVGDAQRRGAGVDGEAARRVGRVGLTGAHRVVVVVCVCHSGKVGLTGEHRFGQADGAHRYGQADGARRFGQADFIALTPLCANAVFPVV